MKYSTILLLVLLTFVGCQSNKNEKAEPLITYDNLFPIYNVSIGRTTSKQLIDLALKSGNNTDNDSHVKIEDLEIYHRNGYASYISFNNKKDLPKPWAFLGQYWSTSYPELLKYLNTHNYKYIIYEYPNIQVIDKGDDKHDFIEKYKSMFNANILVDLPGEVPIQVKFSFISSSGSKADINSSENLYSISFKFFNNSETCPTNNDYISTENVKLNNKKRIALGLSGILTELNRDLHETLESCLINEDSKKLWLSILERDWNDNSREDLYESIQWLKDEGHSSIYNELRDIYYKESDDSLIENAFKMNLSQSDITRLFLIEAIDPIIGDRSLRAWDLGRIISLARWGYVVGFLTESEAWDIIYETSEEIYSLYNNWEDYGTNYVLGRMFWAANRDMFTDYVNKASERLSILLNRNGSVWHDLEFPTKKNDILNSATIYDIYYNQSLDARAWDHYRIGIQNIKSNSLKSALNRFTLAYKFNPNFSEALLQIALTHKKLKNYYSALNYLTEYNNKWPKHYWGYYYSGVINDEVEDIDLAVIQYNKAIALDSSNPLGFLGLAKISLKNKDYIKAIDLIKKSLYLNTEQEVIDVNYLYYLLGIAQFNSHEFENAIESLMNAKLTYSENVYFNYYLGVSYLYLDKPDLETAKQFLEIAEEKGLEFPQKVKDRIFILSNQFTGGKKKSI